MSTKRVVIFHHNDADGRCAAAIAAKKLRDLSYDIKFVEVDYKDAEDHGRILAGFEPGEDVYVLDFSFKPELMAKVRARAGVVVWCDHHATAKAYNYDDLPGFRDFSEKGLSGAECTWAHCFQNSCEQAERRLMPPALTLLGDYDAWRLAHGEQAFAYYEGLKLFDTDPSADLWNKLLFAADGDPSGLMGSIIESGRAAIRYRDNYCAGLRKSFGYETELAGHRAYALNAFQFGSKGHGEKFGEYPVCIAYIHDGRKFTVSLYSETIDVGAIAKSLGGGGHKGAAGFTCEKLPFERKA